MLVEVWKGVLGLEEIGTDEKFFDLGGDSIKAIQMAARLHKHQMTIPIQNILRNLTIKELSNEIQLVTKKLVRR